MPLLSWDGLYSVDLCEAHPDTIFLFGDNLVGYGKGGQAVIRDCPNSFGVPTKALPTNHPDAFFVGTNKCHAAAVERAIHAALLISRRADVVVPVTSDGRVSLGLGLALLTERAPNLYAAIANALQPRVEFAGR